jgi:hypothetical protein
MKDEGGSMNGGEQIDFFERQIAATDKNGETLRRSQGDPRDRIDQLACELYGLTETRGDDAQI